MPHAPPARLALHLPPAPHGATAAVRPGPRHARLTQLSTALNARHGTIIQRMVGFLGDGMGWYSEVIFDHNLNKKRKIHNNFPTKEAAEGAEAAHLEDIRQAKQAEAEKQKKERMEKLEQKRKDAAAAILTLR